MLQQWSAPTLVPVTSSSTHQEQVGAKHFLVETYTYRDTIVLLVKGNCCDSNVAIATRG